MLNKLQQPYHLPLGCTPEAVALDYPEHIWALEQWHWNQPRHYQFLGNLIKLSKGEANPTPSWDSSSHSWGSFWVTEWGEGGVWQVQERSSSSGKQQSQWSKTESHVWVPIPLAAINISLSQYFILIYFQNTKKNKTHTQYFNPICQYTEQSATDFTWLWVWDNVLKTQQILKIHPRGNFLLQLLPTSDISFAHSDLKLYLIFTHLFQQRLTKKKAKKSASVQIGTQEQENYLLK